LFMELGLLRAPRIVVCDSPEGFLEEHSRVARIELLPPLFFRGLSPVEADLGESPVLAGRIEPSTVFHTAD